MEKSKKILFILIIGLIVSCQKEEAGLEEKISTHKLNIYSLGDSVKIIDNQIDSLIQVYSKK
jgi:hypothetical protein